MPNTGRGDDRLARIVECLPQITEKQHEVLGFVAENRTSKEIAWELGISESAVNQRIEAVRGKAGSPTRADLARAYRLYLQDLESGDSEDACKPLTDKNPQLPVEPVVTHFSTHDEPDHRLQLSDGATFNVKAPWQQQAMFRVVPEVLDGPHAGPNRLAAMVAIACGLVLVAVFGLDLATALGRVM